jgi:hypothetical protein
MNATTNPRRKEKGRSVPSRDASRRTNPFGKGWTDVDRRPRRGFSLPPFSEGLPSKPRRHASPRRAGRAEFGTAVKACNLLTYLQIGTTAMCALSPDRLRETRRSARARHAAFNGGVTTPP